MSARTDLLIEIGMEELPPKAMLPLAEALAAAVHTGLKEVRLEPGLVASFAAPRRLAVRVESLNSGQPDEVQVLRGPPVGIAFGDDGAPTRAAEAFASKNGVSVAELGREVTDKGEWLQVEKHVSGKSAAELIPAVLAAAAEGLPIPRRMRWSDSDDGFVRPVHWLVALLNDAVVPCSLYGQTAGRRSRGHRFHHNDWFELEAATSYEDALAERKVIVDFNQRRAKVVDAVSAAAAALGGTTDNDQELIDEVTALCDWPVAVTGGFASAYLELPVEVLASTLKVHQRYFPVLDKAGQPTAHFITVANIDSTAPGEVQRGNERVVAPRLADAAFFWQNDQRTPLADRSARLSTIVYEKALGSIADKAARTGSLAIAIAEHLDIDTASVARAAALARCDLVTEMVGEFPELQGIMGGYYAALDGEAEAVAQAIRDQYRPAFAGDAIPAALAGQILSAADRIDTLAGIFAIGKKPGGNRDPFGLRRAALGLVRILVEAPLDIELVPLIEQAIALQPVDVTEPRVLAEELAAFVEDRARGHYRTALGLERGDVFDAVQARGPSTWPDFDARIRAVAGFVALPAADSLAAANKRIGNFLKQIDEDQFADVNPELFSEAAEVALHGAVLAAGKDTAAMLEQRDYSGVLARLSETRDAVDQFFDDVMVMAEDEAVRGNRLALLRQLRALFLGVADLSMLAS
ncbi:MAG: glycine--tRNA ligase subunit beta [Pseudomonadota bacterium]